MIKFFRHIRKSLFMEQQLPSGQAGKTRRYLKYAIGEIILVVIGILIALQLNNWNENRKQDANFDKLIDALENEIIENIEEANYEINGARQTQVMASKVLLNQISRKAFLEDPNFRSIIELNRLDINSDDISSLVKRQEDIPENYKVLIPHLKNYLKIEQRYTKNDIEYGEQIIGYNDFIIKTQPWYASSYLKVSDSLALNKQIDFYLEDPIYKNYLTNYIDGYSYALREMIGVRSACLVILAEIKRIREHFGANEIHTLFSQYTITPYASVSCDYVAILNSDFKEPATYLPFYNASNQMKTMQWIDSENNVVKDILLQPGELAINPAPKRMQENALIEVVLNGDCITKYQAKQDGFLYIE
jgi:hypothetical protein